MECSDIESGTENERSKHKNPRVISDISVKIKFDSNKKVWTVEKKQDSLMNKNDMEIKHAIRKRNTNVIDFKKNIGLVGLTVKKKYMVRDEVVSPSFKKPSVEKSISIKNKKGSNRAKYNLHRKNNKDSGTCPNSQSKCKIGPKKCRNKISVNTKLIKEDSNTQNLDLTHGKEIKHTERSDQSFTNSMKNSSNPLVPQKCFSPENKPQTLSSTTKTTFNKPGPKCKKVILGQSNVTTGTEKVRTKALETHDKSSTMEMCTNKYNGEEKDRYTSYNNNNDHIKHQFPDHRLSVKINTLINETMNSHSSHSVTSINTQGIVTKVQNVVSKVTAVETEKTIANDNLKRSYNTDYIVNKTVNQESESVAKKMKSENIPNLEAEELNQKTQETSITGYSPPILPIPSYKTILSLLRAQEIIPVKTKYWRINDEDTDIPEYMDTECKFIKNYTNAENNGPQKIKHETNMESERQHKIGHYTNTDNVLNNKKEGKVKKISFEEYRRRASLK